MKTHLNARNVLKTVTSVMCLICLMSLFSISDAIAQERRTHTVAQGETLFSISRQYNVSVEDLRRWNNLSGNQINIGQRLVIQGGTPAQGNDPRIGGQQTRTGQIIQHRVTSGETLFSLSRRYGVSVDDIKTWNNLTSNLLEIGQVLEIQSTQNVVEQPRPTDTTPTDTEPEAGRVVSGNVGSAYYVVKSGDTLIGIASMFETTPAELRELNRLRNDRLAVGQVLLVRRPQGLPSISTAEEGTTPQGRFITHTVARGERLVDVLRKFQMTELELTALNPDINVSELRQGQQISVLLPPNVTYANPYRETPAVATTETTESIRVSRYNDTDRGRSTTNGDLYNPNAFTAGHNRLQLGSVIYIENPDNGLGLFVLINDRIVEQGLKLSHAAFDNIGLRPSSSNTVVIKSPN